MMSLIFGLFTQVSGSGPLGPLVCFYKNVCTWLGHTKYSILAGAYCGTEERNLRGNVAISSLLFTWRAWKRGSQLNGGILSSGETFSGLLGEVDRPLRSGRYIKTTPFLSDPNATLRNVPLQQEHNIL